MTATFPHDPSELRCADLTRLVRSLHRQVEVVDFDVLENKTYAPYGLDAAGFHWVKKDPLAPIRSLNGGLREALAGEQGCLTCHSFRGAGGRAHHALALDAKPYGAFALPLEEYPSDVLRRFLFEQDAVAKSFGVKPLRVDKTVAGEIVDMVSHEKNQKREKK